MLSKLNKNPSPVFVLSNRIDCLWIVFAFGYWASLLGILKNKVHITHSVDRTNTSRPTHRLFVFGVEGERKQWLTMTDRRSRWLTVLPLMTHTFHSFIILVLLKLLEFLWKNWDSIIVFMYFVWLKNNPLHGLVGRRMKNVKKSSTYCLWHELQLHGI